MRDEQRWILEFITYTSSIGSCVWLSQWNISRVRFLFLFHQSSDYIKTRGGGLLVFNMNSSCSGSSASNMHNTTFRNIGTFACYFTMGSVQKRMLLILDLLGYHQYRRFRQNIIVFYLETPLSEILNRNRQMILIEEAWVLPIIDSCTMNWSSLPRETILLEIWHLY